MAHKSMKFPSIILLLPNWPAIRNALRLGMRREEGKKLPMEKWNLDPDYFP